MGGIPRGEALLVHQGRGSDQGIRGFESVRRGVSFEEGGCPVRHLFRDVQDAREVPGDEFADGSRIPSAGATLEQFKIGHCRNHPAVKRDPSQERASPLVPTQVPDEDVSVERHRAKRARRIFRTHPDTSARSFRPAHSPNPMGSKA